MLFYKRNLGASIICDYEVYTLFTACGCKCAVTYCYNNIDGLGNNDKYNKMSLNGNWCLNNKYDMRTHYHAPQVGSCLGTQE